MYVCISGIHHSDAVNDHLIANLLLNVPVRKLW